MTLSKVELSKTVEQRSELVLYRMKEPVRFLGYDIERDYIARTIVISQEAYAGKNIAQAGFQDLHATALPMTPGWKSPAEAPLLDDVTS